MNKNLVIIPFAFMDNYRGGVNLKKHNKLDVYLKNCCVSALSARANGGHNIDVAIVTNMDLPEPFAGILQRGKVNIIKRPFDCFRFDRNYKWMLAFYKLCALKHVVDELNYERYLCLDSDIYVQGALLNIWRECDAGSLMLYDIADGIDNVGFRNDAGTFTGTNPLQWTHYGGEFIAASQIATRRFMTRAEEVFQEMQKRAFVTQSGDEFITSVAAQTCGLPIHHAGAYVYRYWTRRFRLISTNYRFNPVTVLHVPAEKETGMLTIYRRYARHGRLPQRRASVWRLLHLSRAPWEIALYWRVMDLLRRTPRGFSFKS